MLGEAGAQLRVFQAVLSRLAEAQHLSAVVQDVSPAQYATDRAVRASCIQLLASSEVDGAFEDAVRLAPTVGLDEWELHMACVAQALARRSPTQSVVTASVSERFRGAIDGHEEALLAQPMRLMRAVATDVLSRSPFDMTCVCIIPARARGARQLMLVIPTQLLALLPQHATCDRGFAPRLRGSPQSRSPAPPYHARRGHLLRSGCAQHAVVARPRCMHASNPSCVAGMRSAKGVRPPHTDGSLVTKRASIAVLLPLPLSRAIHFALLIAFGSLSGSAAVERWLRCHAGWSHATVLDRCSRRR